MIKLEIIKEFTLQEYKKVTIIKKSNTERVDKFTKGDVITCDEKMAEYLTGGNQLKLKVAEILEVIPEKKEEKQETTKKTTKRATKKNKED